MCMYVCVCNHCSSVIVFGWTCFGSKCVKMVHLCFNAHYSFGYRFPSKSIRCNSVQQFQRNEKYQYMYYYTCTKANKPIQLRSTSCAYYVFGINHVAKYILLHDFCTLEFVVALLLFFFCLFVSRA